MNLTRFVISSTISFLLNMLMVSQFVIGLEIPFTCVGWFLAFVALTFRLLSGCYFMHLFLCQHLLYFSKLMFDFDLQVLRSMRNELDGLKREVRKRQGSEDQMKQV